jgi:hypothetical protein
LQTAPSGDAIFLGQPYVDRQFQRQEIGSCVVQGLIEEPDRTRKAVTLGVVKINAAHYRYERLGFHVTHEDQHRVYMRRDHRCAAPSKFKQTRIRNIAELEAGTCWGYLRPIGGGRTAATFVCRHRDQERVPVGRITTRKSSASVSIR